MKEYQLKDLRPARSREYKIDYASELNPSQLEAVEIRKGPALVIAGAGSGKTRTLIYRVARLVEDGATPEQVLLLTFTRKAAGEMLRRASHILDERCGHVSGGTFHSLPIRYSGAMGNMWDLRKTSPYWTERMPRMWQALSGTRWDSIRKIRDFPARIPLPIS